MHSNLIIRGNVFLVAFEVFVFIQNSYQMASTIKM